MIISDLNQLEIFSKASSAVVFGRGICPWACAPPPCPQKPEPFEPLSPTFPPILPTDNMLPQQEQPCLKPGEFWA